MGEKKKGVQSESGLLVKAISVVDTTNIPANATSNNSNHCKHSARVSENSLPAEKKTQRFTIAFGGKSAFDV